MTKKVYLAGPEVFLVNAREILDEKIALTREAGLVPVSPGDLTPPKTDSARQLGLELSRIDERLMDFGDAIIANLTPFRGIAADPGTCFELGYMCAQGKLAFAYTNMRTDNAERSRGFYAGATSRDTAGLERGPDGIIGGVMSIVPPVTIHKGDCILFSRPAQSQSPAGPLASRGGAVLVAWSASL